MKQFHFSSNFSIYLRVIFLYLLLLSFVGCSSRKKEIKETKIENQQIATRDSSSSSKTKSAEALQTQDKSTEVVNEEIIDYEGCTGDSLKVIKKGPDGKVISELLITGKGKAKFYSNKINRQNEISKKAWRNQETEKKAAVKAVVKKLESSEGKEIHVARSGFSFLTWFWIVLILILLLILWYFRQRINYFFR